MKKQSIIIIIGIILVAIIVGVFFMNKKNSENTEKVKIDNVDDMKAMLKSIYEKLNDELPTLETAEIDVSDEMQVSAYTGLSSNKDIEKMVISEPLMNAQAYSALVIKVKDGANIENIKKDILDNINMRKWICVSAEKLYVTNSGNVIFVIMSNEEWASSVYKEFKNYVNNNIGKELEKSEEENIELPTQIVVQ